MSDFAFIIFMHSSSKHHSSNEPVPCAQPLQSTKLPRNPWTQSPEAPQYKVHHPERIRQNSYRTVLAWVFRTNSHVLFFYVIPTYLASIWSILRRYTYHPSKAKSWMAPFYTISLLTHISRTTHSLTPSWESLANCLSCRGRFYPATVSYYAPLSCLQITTIIGTRLYVEKHKSVIDVIFAPKLDRWVCVCAGTDEIFYSYHYYWKTCQ